MPICPKNEDCGYIDHLNAFVKETVKYEIWPEAKLFPDKPDPGLNWGRAEPTEGSATHTEFCCPKCGKTIFDFEGEDANDYTIVEEFLKT